MGEIIAPSGVNPEETEGRGEEKEDCTPYLIRYVLLENIDEKFCAQLLQEKFKMYDKKYNF
jgi:hypothetical protein